MEDKNIQIKKLIIEHAHQKNIPPAYIAIIEDNYHDDQRDIEVIKKEIELLFLKLSLPKNEKRKDDNQESVNHQHQILDKTNGQSMPETLTQSDINSNASEKNDRNMSIFDNQRSVNEQPTQPITFTSNNCQNISTGEELDSMFDSGNKTEQSQNNRSNFQNNSKGKSYVKSNGKSILFDSEGFLSIMNISFILTIITILGIILSTIIILIKKA